MGVIDTVRRPLRVFVCLAAAVALMVTVPSAAATGSGGWNPLGHGKKAC